MATSHTFKILFFLQSVVFTIFIINFQQQSAVIRKPAKMFDICKCDEQEIKCTHTHTNAPGTHSKEPSVRGPLSNCSLIDIKKRPGVMMLTTTNLGFLDITLNMLESVKRAGVCVNTTIIAEDQKVYKYLQKITDGDPGIHVLMTSSGETNSSLIPRGDRRLYFGFMQKRQNYILNLLEQDLEILFSDSDTFWFRDPFTYFQGDFDMSMVDSRSPYPLRTPRGEFCAGFIYLKPTNATIQFVKTWIQVMKQRGWGISDQAVMNILLKRDKPVHMNIKPLDPNIFPWGPKFYSLLKEKANYSTVVMHAASIRGHEAKVTKFKSSNMWLVNNTNEGLVALEN